MCMVVVLTWDNVKLMGKFSEAEILKQFKTSMGCVRIRTDSH